MLFQIGIIITVFTCALGDKDDKKWIWGNNNRNDKDTSRHFDSSPSARYEVYENENYGNRPNFGNNNRPFLQRPLNNEPFPQRPIGNEPPIGSGPGGQLFRPNERPGGVYGPGNVEGNYGQGHVNTYHPEDGVLTGPIPSWVKQGPFKEFDRCKCSEKFNCNSPGISYGHCDVGKQYCCYSIKKSSQIGGPLPSRPVHSPENGLLVGPQGSNRPIIPPPNRPIGRPVDGPLRPNYDGPINGNYRPGRPSYGGNIHSLENGILVGPGGPFDRPQGGFGAVSVGGFGRSAKKD